MSDTNMIWMGVAAVALVFAVVVAVITARSSRARARERHMQLQQRFGPEYDRAVGQYGQPLAERLLEKRVKRVDNLSFRDLSAAEQSRFSTLWTSIQAQFVDDPRTAVTRANQLIKEVMRARGYAADDGFEQRAEDLSVDHPDVVQHYRAARALAQGGTEREMNTEELRQAIVHYRVLFADLLQPVAPANTAAWRPAHA